MPVPVTEIKFGETDARNELFQQDRYGSRVFENSFQIPPGIKVEDLLHGARFFIYGLKGCGKTALLLHIQRNLEELGGSSKVVLFKTGVGEAERAQLAAPYSLIDTRSEILVQYDYSINWLWFIYRNIVRLLETKSVLQGAEVAADLRRLLGVDRELRESTFSDLSFPKVKLAAKAGINSGPFTAEISAEVEGIRRESPDRTPIEIIELCERYLPKIVLKPQKRCFIFFDELELFWNRPDQKERDLFLIRDLLQAVIRVNRALGSRSASFVVYASVRSEVLEEVNRVGPEIVRDIRDFGVHVRWNSRATIPEQPILRIVEAKIRESEIEQEEIPADDVWETYFENDRIFGRTIREHLLDITMFKPRNLIARLSLAAASSPNVNKISNTAFEDTSAEFSLSVWRDIEEELRGSYSAQQVSDLKAVFTGFRAVFDVDMLEERIDNLARFVPSVLQSFKSRMEIVNVCQVLYRVGAIGNIFQVEGARGPENRDRWSFRDMGEPTLDQEFVVHKSLRKVFQMSFID